jgi:hypothetical protein
MVTYYRNLNDMIQAAQHAIDTWCTNTDKRQHEKQWLQKILDILSNEKYVTVQRKNGINIDIEAIANTKTYASFFDVCNNIEKFNIDIEPIITEKLENKYYTPKTFS